MTILESLYQCNMCGKEMKHKTPKLVMGEWSGDSFEKLDIHICTECRPELVAFANGKKDWIETVTIPCNVKPKKKHEFYGNQYLLRNRKSRK